MPADWILLGAAAARTVAQLSFKELPAAQSVSESLIDWLGRALQDRREARAVARHVERVGDRISEDLEAYFRAEFRGLEENEQAAAIAGVVDGLASAELNYEAFAAASFDESYVVRVLLKRRRGERLSAAGDAIYGLLVTEVAAYVVNATLAMPQFPARVGVSILQREAEAFAAIDEALTLMPKRVLARLEDASLDKEQDEAIRFELDYRRRILRRLDDLAIYGLGGGAYRRRYPLSLAYVSLMARRRDANVDWTRSAPVEEALAGGKRFLISGEAGSGKTTILQWVAVQAARRTFTGVLETWNTSVPFFLQLRTYSGDTALPVPTKFVDGISPLLAERAPERWVIKQLQSGRAIVLVDGLDELVDERREEVAAWLGDLTETYPNARYILTSRPSAVAKTEIPGAFERLSLEPMAGPDVLKFIDHWHRAAAFSVEDEEQAQELVRLQGRLTAALADSQAVRALTSNPLLCAMICTLNMERRGLMPQGRVQLYDTALGLLIRRRDEERGVQTLPATLDEASTTVLLQDLAYWMLRNDRARISSSTAAQRVARRLATLHQSHLPAEDVLSFLTERSGVLREPNEGTVDFVHLSFQEYLAALEIVDQDDVGELIGRVRHGQWFEVAVNVAGRGSRPQREELVSQLISNDGSERRLLLALACVGVIASLDPQLTIEVRERATRFLPPKSPEDAIALASSGPIALDLLSSITPGDLNEDTAAAVVRGLARVGGSGGLEQVKRWAGDGRAVVQQELLDAWPSFEVARYAEEVLSHLMPHAADAELTVGPIQALHLYRLPWVRRVVIEAAGADLGLDVVPTSARVVTLRNSSVADLGRVSDGALLRELAVIHCASISSTASLESASNLEVLHLVDLASLTSIEALGGLPMLRKLWLERLPSLSRVPSGSWPSLAELRVDDCSACRGLDDDGPPGALEDLRLVRVGVNSLSAVRAMDRLTRLAVEWAQSLVSVDGVGGAAKLRDAKFAHCSNLEDLRDLSGAGELQRLSLIACPAVTDVEPLVNARVVTDLELIQCRGLGTVEPLSRMPALQILDLTGCSLELDLSHLSSIPFVTFPTPT